LYSHHLAIGVLITVVAHAWCAWYFLLPPLLLWLLDKTLRLMRTRSAVVLAMTPHPGNITSVAFAAFDTPHRPGSWVWVNFPVISSTQWHPFSISSAPLDQIMTLHIKDMGEGTFTRQFSSWSLFLNPYISVIQIGMTQIQTMVLQHILFVDLFSSPSCPTLSFLSPLGCSRKHASNVCERTHRVNQLAQRMAQQEVCVFLSLFGIRIPHPAPVPARL
jgi:hypothetical protein